MQYGETFVNNTCSHSFENVQNLVATCRFFKNVLPLGKARVHIGFSPLVEEIKQCRNISSILEFDVSQFPLVALYSGSENWTLSAWKQIFSGINLALMKRIKMLFILRHSLHDSSSLSSLQWAFVHDSRVNYSPLFYWPRQVCFLKADKFYFLIRSVVKTNF